MLAPLAALLSGLIFGLGLIISGMTDPSKVLGFLDVAGAWDPSLAFVMGGAIMIGIFAFGVVSRPSRALLGGPLQMPETWPIDRALLLGSLTFGVGWGLAGYCPGPAVASILIGGIKPLLFTAGMLAGMAIFEIHGMLARSRTGEQL
jgi:uncharacterized membrane protein YedE/YeeE